MFYSFLYDRHAFCHLILIINLSSGFSSGSNLSKFPISFRNYLKPALYYFWAFVLISLSFSPSVLLHAENSVLTSFTLDIFRPLILKISIWVQCLRISVWAHTAAAFETRPSEIWKKIKHVFGETVTSHLEPSLPPSPGYSWISLISQPLETYFVEPLIFLILAFFLAQSSSLNFADELNEC